MLTVLMMPLFHQRQPMEVIHPTRNLEWHAREDR